jgi:hypothetical protein
MRRADVPEKKAATLNCRKGCEPETILDRVLPFMSLLTKNHI